MNVRVVCALAAVTIGVPVLGDELYRQNAQLWWGGISSQDARNPGGLGWFSETVDNFTSAANWTITSVEFWGSYTAVQAGHTQGFTVRFYKDNAGSVGPMVYQQDHFTFTEVVDWTDPTLGFSRYDTKVDLAPAFHPPAPGSYWMSVVAILDRGGTANEPQWWWVVAQSVHGPFCQQWVFAPGQFAPVEGQDVGFVLFGTAGCYPDCDGNGTLNINDFICFQTKFALGDPYADCDGNGVKNINDFICFQTKFALGC